MHTKSHNFYLEHTSLHIHHNHVYPYQRWIVLQGIPRPTQALVGAVGSSGSVYGPTVVTICSTTSGITPHVQSTYQYYLYS